MTSLANGPKTPEDGAQTVQDQLQQALAKQDAIRHELTVLHERLEKQQEKLADLESLARERDSLVRQVNELKRRLNEARDASTTPASPSQDTYSVHEVDDALAEEYEHLLAAQHTLEAERNELAAECTRLRDALREQSDTLAQKQATIAELQAECDGWVSEADKLTIERDKLRQLLNEASERMEFAEADQQRLRTELVSAQQAEAAVRERLAAVEQELRNERQARLALEEQLNTLQNTLTGEVAASTSLDPAVALLQDLVTMVGHPREPESGLREEVRALHDELSALRERVESLEALLRDAGPKVPEPALSAPINVGPEAASTIAQEVHLGQPPGTAGIAEPDEPPADPPWEDEFDRIERAWLAGRQVGDRQHGRCFLEVVRLARQTPSLWRDDDALLRRLDVIKKMYRKEFCYCLLRDALRRLHQPSYLEPAVVVKAMEAVASHRHPAH